MFILLAKVQQKNDIRKCMPIFTLFLQIIAL